MSGSRRLGRLTYASRTRTPDCRRAGYTISDKERARWPFTAKWRESIHHGMGYACNFD